MLNWIKRMLRWRRRQREEEKLEADSTEADNPSRGLETGNRALAQPLPGGAGTDPPRPDSAQRDREHGLRGRTGGPGGDGGGTRTPRDATRYVETRLGILSYTELAPHLARNVLALEKRIEDGKFDRSALDDALLLQFQSLICGDLVPQLAGWRRVDVVVGEHDAPQFFKVPVLVREYGRDLDARLSAAGGMGESILETLAFAEGRLLWIHPFADFNGRATRVWLREILRRLDLPPVQLAPTEGPTRSEYLAALRAADRADWRPLMDVWRRRFEDA
jgi:CRISPR-associated endonuclease/helicase Cas3